MIFGEAMSAGYQLGDVVFRDPSNEAAGRCNKCKRYDCLEIKKVPDAALPTGLRGFWKVPKE